MSPSSPLQPFLLTQCLNRYEVPEHAIDLTLCPEVGGQAETVEESLDPLGVDGGVEGVEVDEDVENPLPLPLLCAPHLPGIVSSLSILSISLFS